MVSLFSRKPKRRFGFNKVFCIGMNKTGTSSLHQGLLRLGLRSLHHGPTGHDSLAMHMKMAQELSRTMARHLDQDEDPLQDLPQFDAYSDIDTVVYRFDEMDRHYPGSRFIYTLRDTPSWLESRRKHVLRNRENVRKGLYQTDFLDIDFDAWVEEKERHLARVKSWFTGRPDDLLFMDITRGDGFEALCPFLGLPLPGKDVRFPHRNEAPGVAAGAD